LSSAAADGADGELQEVIEIRKKEKGKR